MHLAPALIVRRRTDRNLVRVFQEISAHLSAGGPVPLGIQRLVEIRDDRAGGLNLSPADDAASPSVKEFYLPLPSNEAQQQIVERLEARQGVLVQGPPGTGKSHTIVNLVCHLLATGRRILITSHTARALKVLKGYLTAHAGDVAPLCVSLLGDDSQAVHELEDSVQGILSRMHSWDSDRNGSEIRRLQGDLQETRSELAQALSDLRLTRSNEAGNIDLGFGNYAGTPRAIAECIAEERERFGWLQAFDPGGDPPPLANADALELLTLIRKLEADKDAQPLRHIPDPTVMPSVERCEVLVKREQALKLQLDQSRALSNPSFTQLASGEAGARARLGASLRQYLWDIDQIGVLPDAWIQRAVLDVAADKHALWQQLHDATQKRCSEIEVKTAQASECKITGLEGHELATVAADANVLKVHINSGGSLGLALQVNPFAPKHVKAALYVSKTIRVNGRLCSSADALGQLLDWMHVATTFDQIGAEWAEVDAPAGPKIFQHRLHEFKRRLEHLQKVLALRTNMAAAREHAHLLGLPAIPFSQPSEIRCLLEIIDAVDIHEEWRTTERELASQIEELRRGMRHPDAHYLVAEATYALENRDTEGFARVASEIEEYRKMLWQHQRRDQLLSNLGACAKLRDALVSSASEPVWHDRLASLAEAWNWYRASDWLERFADPRRERALLQTIDSCQQRIRQRTEELTAYKAWEYVLARLRQEEREHLSAWRLAIKKVGKGTGKYAPQYRREARQHLERCRSAIPAWVMPVYRVAETIRPQPDMFDVVIIDEASQSGPEALFLMYIAKKIVVVGDDQQISPESVGLDRDAVNSLRERHIKDLPHEDALGVDNSFFEQAEIRFSGRIRLREHFRCMPEIIEFSNALCYQAEPLIPLRQYGAGRLAPVVTRHVPQGYAKGSNQRVVNEPEAEAIVQQIVQCISDPVYEKKTIGVISLQGSAQANLIRDLLMDRIGVQKMLERNIVCGDAYAFQGDERDIIFLSMVAALNDGHKVGVLSKDSDKRRFNVAASRARDQMWLFHSLALEDLSQFCFRRRLLEYCLNPTIGVGVPEGLSVHELRRKAYESDRSMSRPPVPFDSWFEVDVFLRITDRGFRVLPQYELASKRIDLLVEGMRGRLAVECDGDRWHGLEQWEQDVARQRMLERCGLEFWRLRASTFYRDPQRATEPLWQLLDHRGIRPEGEPRSPRASSAPPGAPTFEQDQEPDLGQLGEEDAELEAESANEGEPLASELGQVFAAEPFDDVAAEHYRAWEPRPLPVPHTASPAEVMQGLLEIIDAEGPVVCRRAYTLYNRACGGNRLGRQTVKIMNRAVSRAIRLGRLMHAEGRAVAEQIVQTVGRPLVVPRMRGPRRLDEIPPSEIAAVRAAIQANHASWDEELIVRRLAQFYRVSRLTTQIRKILSRS
jgi:very-short-patch-repair endonuclease